MRPKAGTALLLLAVAAGGCESDQPTLVSSQTVTLDFRSSGASSTTFRTWTMFEDSNTDGSPDDVDGDGQADSFMWCEQIPNMITSANSAPWPFTVSLKVLGPGDSSPTVIAQNVANDPARARYDTSSVSHLAAIPPGSASGVVNLVHPRGQCSFDPDIACNPSSPGSTLCADNEAGTCVPQGTCSLDPSQACTPGTPGELTCERQGLGNCDVDDVTRRFVFQNDATRRQRTAADEALLLAPDNILFLTDQAFAEQLKSDASGVVSVGGICPGTYLGPANIADMELPLTFELEKGATLIVEAKRLPQQPGGGIPFFSEPGLTALFTVEGSPATVSGTTAIGSGEDEFIQFFFQSQ